MVRVPCGGGESRFELAKRSVYWRDEEARAVLDAWMASGQSVAAFAAEHGLQRARLHRWRARLMPEAEREAAALFWPLNMASAPAQSSGPDTWRIDLGDGVSIAVPCAGGAALLAETLAAVREGWAC